MIHSGHGGVSGVAVNFVSPGGTDVYADGLVEFFSLKSQNKHYESKNRWWGLSSKTREEVRESATPTLFYDMGKTRLHSSKSDIDVQGALFLGDGDLDFSASHGKVKFGCDILNHAIHEKERSIGVSVPGMAAWSAGRSDGAWSAMSATDRTLAKVNALLNSSGSAEFAASTLNLGIDIYNTTNDLMRGIANDTFGSELLSRYGLGGEYGFDPSVSLTFTQSTTHMRYQTTGPGGVDRGGNLNILAGEGVELHNGVSVRAQGDAVLDTPSIEAYSAELQSSYKHQSKSVTMGATASGSVTDVGVSVSKMTSKSTAHQHAQLEAGGHMQLHHNGEAVGSVNLHGANIVAGSADIAIDQLNITDVLNKTETRGFSASASSSGAVSAYAHQGSESVVGAPSGIHVVDGLNTNGHQFKVNKATMYGGGMTTNGENHANIHTLEASDVQEHSRHRGIGVSGNVHDLERLGGAQPSNRSGESAIATMSIAVDRKDYKAVSRPTLFGAKGDHSQVDTLVGSLNTESADGRTVTADHQVQFMVDVPITNAAHIQQAQENMAAGMAVLFPSERVTESVSRHPIDPLVPSLSDEPEEHITLSAEAISSENDASEASGESDVELPNLTQEMIDHAIQNMDEQDHAYMKQVLTEVESELGHQGTVSPETKEKLMGKFAEVMLKSLKMGGEFGWSKLIANMGDAYSDNAIKMLLTKGMRANGGVKLFMTSKGVMFTFAMNMALGGGGPVDECFKEAAIATADDMLVGFILSSVGANPVVGVGIFAANLLDTLTYDEAVVIENFRLHAEYRDAAMAEFKKGTIINILSGIGLMEASRDLSKAATSMEGLHQSLRILHPIDETRKAMSGPGSSN